MEAMMSLPTSGPIRVRGQGNNEYELTELFYEERNKIYFGAGIQGDYENKKVAIKLQHWNTDTGKYQFNEQLTILKTLQHPNIISLYDWNTIQNDGILVLPLLEGMDLDDFFEIFDRVPLRTAITIMLPLLKAIHCCHNNNVLHGNIAPWNIYLAVTERLEQLRNKDHTILRPEDVCLIDFKWTINTSTNQILEEQEYTAFSAPETLNNKTICTRSEIFSAGLIFFRLLAGKLLFQEIVQHITNQPFEQSSENLETLLQENTPPQQALPIQIPLLLRKMLHYQIETRPTAEQAIQSLQEVQSNIQEPQERSQSQEAQEATITKQEVQQMVSKISELQQYIVASIRSLKKVINSSQENLSHLQLRVLQLENKQLQASTTEPHNEPKLRLTYREIGSKTKMFIILWLIASIATLTLSIDNLFTRTRQEPRPRKITTKQPPKKVIPKVPPKKQKPQITLKQIWHEQQRYHFSNSRAFATNSTGLTLITTNDGNTATIFNAKKQKVCSYTFPKNTLHLSAAIWIEQWKSFAVGYDYWPDFEDEKCECIYNSRIGFSLISPKTDKRLRCQIQKHKILIRKCCSYHAEPQTLIHMAPKKHFHVTLGMFGITQRKKNIDKKFIKALYLKKKGKKIQHRVKPLKKVDRPSQKFLKMHIEDYSTGINSGIRIFRKKQGKIHFTKQNVTLFSSSPKNTTQIPGTIQRFSIAEPYLMVHSRQTIVEAIYDFFILYKLHDKHLP